MAIVITNLTSGSDTTNNPSTSASISPAAGSIVIVTCSFAVAGGGSNNASDYFTISGCGLTWTQLGHAFLEGTDRRSLFAYKGVGTPSSGTLSITAGVGSGDTWTENMWVVDQVAGMDETTPFGTFYTGRGNTTSVNVTVSETPDAGDFVYAGFRLENSSLSPTLNGELSNQIALLEGGTDVRAMLTAYDSTPDASPTPGITWTGTNGCDAFAFIINVGGASQSNAPRAAYQYSLRRR